jgi:hypothetical protein
VSLADDIDPSSRKTVYLVHIADVLSEHYQIGRGLEKDVRAIDNAVWEYLGMDFGVCQDLLGEVLGEVSEFRSICDLFASPMKKTPVAAAKPAPLPTANLVRATPQSAPTQNLPVASAAAPASGQGVDRLMDGVKQLALLAGDDLCPNIAEPAKYLLDADAGCVLLPHGDDLDNVGAAGFP